MMTAFPRFQQLLAASGTYLAAFAGALMAGPQTGVDITVQAYNWAHVELGTLTAAQDEAARIFRVAGVGIVWLNCPLTVVEAEAYRICMEPATRDRFVLRIVYSVPAGFGNTSMGVALNETGIYASVFYQRVDEFANEGIATHSQILGHAMAHELGHLLLDLRGHTNFGIMRGRWNAQDLRSASMGALLFSPRERALVRDAATRRMRAQVSPK